MYHEEISNTLKVTNYKITSLDSSKLSMTRELLQIKKPKEMWQLNAKYHHRLYFAIKNIIGTTDK